MSGVCGCVLSRAGVGWSLMMNRPEISERGKVRDKWVHIRVTKDQSRRYEARAKRLGVSVSVWLRSLADRDSRLG